MRRALLLCSLLWWACPGPNPSPDGGPKPAPSVSSVTPDHGPEAGGTMVTVAGANFQSGANVSFGGTPATQVIVSSPLILTARTPPGTGKVDVKVLNPDTQAATLGNAFTYQTVTQHVVSEALILNPADASDTSGSAMVSVTVVGQVEVPGVTAGAGQGAGVKAQVGYATSLSSPPAQGDFLWGIASYTADADGATSGDLARDQYEGQLMLPGASGMQVKNYYLAVRFSVDGGNTWTIGDRDGAANGFDAAQIPQLHVSQAQVGWCKLGGQVVQPPDQLKLKEGAAGPTVYAQVYAMSVTDAAGAGAGITGQLGYGPQGSDPATGWTWADAAYNTDTGSGANDEYQAALPVPAAGNYQFAYRFALGSGPYKYCDADGSDNGFDATQYGALQVTPVGIDWCNLQFPSALALKVGQSTGQMYGRVYGLGVTEAAGAGPLLSAEVGFGPPGSNPDSTWSWSAATYNQEEPNGQEEWQGAFTAPAAGSYSYTFRFSYDGGTQVYCDLDGTDNGVSTSQLGALTTTAVGIDDCQLEAPANVSTIPGGPTGSVTGLVHAASVTDAAGQGANITGEVGYGPAGTLPSTWASWTAASYLNDSSTSDRYTASFSAPNAAGSYDVAYRFQYAGGAYTYCDLDGSANGYSSANACVLTVGAPAVQACNLQYVDATTVASGDRVTAYGRVTVPGVTSAAGPAPGLRSQFGVGTQGDNASSSSQWGWAEASFNVDVPDSGAEEWWLTFQPAYTGTRAVSFRVSLDDGGTWSYCDVNGSDVNGYEVNQQWALAVTPHADLDFCNLQFPAAMTLDAGEQGTVYGQVYEPGVTPDANAPLIAQLGSGNEAEDPGLAWSWAPASFNLAAGNNNEYQAPLSAAPGTHSYAFRYSRDGGSWCFGDLDGNGATVGGGAAGFSGGANLGGLTVVP